MPADVTGNRGVSAMKRHGEYYFRDGNICFLVENTLFRLHRYFLERESEYFRDRLLPRSDEDGSPDSPYIIQDVKQDEFADFIWVWYNPQDKKKWLTILKLATLWQFGEIRNLAIRQLEKMNLQPIEKILTYRQHSVDSGLLFPSYLSLCTSPTLPSPEEGKKLTLETVLRLASARELVLLRASELGCRTPTIASAPEDIVKAVVAQLFDLTLHSNDQHVRVDGQAANNGNASGEGPEVPTVKPPNPGKKKAGEAALQPSLKIPSMNGVGGKVHGQK